MSLKMHLVGANHTQRLRVNLSVQSRPLGPAHFLFSPSPSPPQRLAAGVSVLLEGNRLHVWQVVAAVRLLAPVSNKASMQLWFSFGLLCTVNSGFHPFELSLERSCGVVCQ